jgi:hypothetical protein
LPPDFIPFEDVTINKNEHAKAYIYPCRISYAARDFFTRAHESI